VDEHLLEAMAQRLGRDRGLYAQRKALSEHPFGTMKRGMDQGYFLLKGLRKVRGEFSLPALAYNLKRVINLAGVPRLLEALAWRGLTVDPLPPRAAHQNARAGSARPLNRLPPRPGLNPTSGAPSR